jgi:hypothetical protein
MVRTTASIDFPLPLAGEGQGRESRGQCRITYGLGASRKTVPLHNALSPNPSPTPGRGELRIPDLCRYLFPEEERKRICTIFRSDQDASFWSQS